MVVKIKQINLNKCVAATTLIGKDEDECIYLLQEPYYDIKGNVGLPAKGSFFAARKSRAAIYIKLGISAIPVNDYTGEDISTVLLEGGPLRKPIIVSSVYLANDKEPILPLWESLVRFCRNKNIPMICGVDSNTHSVLWEMPPKSNAESARADKLEEFIATWDLNVQNTGNKPTFVRPHLRQETIIDITLTYMCDVTCWEVTQDETSSDHRLICFRYDDTRKATKVEIRCLKKADWSRFQSELKKVKPPEEEEWSEQHIETKTEELYEVVQDAMDAACPKIKVRRKESYAWWNEEIEEAYNKYKTAEKRYFKRTVNNRFDDLWQEVKQLRHNFTKLIRKGKQKSWQNFVTDVESTSEMAKLNKIINRESKPKVGLLKKNNEMASSTKESLKILMDEHFPGNENAGVESEANSNCSKIKKLDWITPQRVKNAIAGFDDHKAAGLEDIKPIVLKHFPENIITYLVIIYTACINLGYTPKKWRESFASFIPKPKKGDYTNPRAFRPISLTSFLFKTLERLVCWHNDETAFKENPLHRRQYAFRKGYSTERAMSNALNIIEKGFFNAQYTVGVFLDIKGAFDNISTKAIVKALEKKGVDKDIIKWYNQYLNNRVCSAELGDTKRKVKLTRGAPQGGVASPVMAWNCAFDLLLESFDGLSTKIIGYADDALQLSTSLCLDTALMRAQQAIRLAEKWARKVGVQFSPEKTAVIIFTKKRGKPNKKLKLYGKEVDYVKSTKYLGVIFDEKLTFKEHLEDKIKNAKKALHIAKKAFSKNWGPDPKKIKYLYTGIIRPAITYGSLIWHRAVETNVAKDKLKRLNRLAMLTMAHVRKATPTDSLEVIYDLPPLDLMIKEMAAKAFVRLGCQTINYETKSHVYLIRKWLGTSWEYESHDNDEKYTLWDRNFEVNIADGNDEIKDDKKIRCYTDGSLMEGKAGAGVVIYKGKKILHKLQKGLGNRSVFQAEIEAIKMGAEYLYDLVEGREIIFKVDSQAAIKALESRETNSRITNDAFRVLKTLAKENRVRIEWIKAHVGHEGNELADDAAKKAADLPPEAESRPPKRELWNAIETITRERWQQRWETSRICRQTKYFFNEINKGKSTQLLEKSRKRLGLLVRFLTGHAFLRRQNFIVNRGRYPSDNDSENVVCRLCEEEEETPHHIITRCPALANDRLMTFGTAFLPEKPEWTIRQLEALLRDDIAALEEDEDEVLP